MRTIQINKHYKAGDRVMVIMHNGNPTEIFNIAIGTFENMFKDEPACIIDGKYVDLASEGHTSLIFKIESTKQAVKRKNEFIMKWLGNSEKPYTQDNREEMWEDLDSLVEHLGSNEVKKTSAEWLAEFNHEYREKAVVPLMIFDADGWDRSNYDFSFNKEKLTKKEFKERVNNSTVQSIMEFQHW